jgi:hypothetical protein
MMWALDAVTSDSVARLILVVLGRDSDDQGKGAALTIPEIATQALCSPRTAQRKIQDLAKEGLIVPGDESIVADRQANYRPAVWDLAMPSKPTPTTTRRGDTATPLGVTRRHPKDGQGRHSDTPRGDTATPLEAGDLASTERVTTSTPFGSAAPTQAPTREHAREAAPRTTRGTRLPADWKPDAELAQWTLDAGMSREQARRTLEDFRDYWTEKTGKDATKVTWSGTWKRWVRRELDNKPSRNSGRRPGKTLTLNDVLDDLDATEGGYRPDPMVIDMEAC